jgi:hypothetical protein
LATLSEGIYEQGQRLSKLWTVCTGAAARLLEHPLTARRLERVHIDKLPKIDGKRADDTQRSRTARFRTGIDLYQCEIRHLVLLRRHRRRKR